MTGLELDHVVIFCTPEAPEARALEAAGLQGFGGHTRHGKLGTASTSFFFANLTYLELLWVADEAAARQNFEPLSLDVVGRTRWRESGVSPFGLMLRRQQPDSREPLPFPCKQMPADWMPPGTTVEFNGETVSEPYYGVCSEALSFRGFRANIPNLPHSLGIQNLTHVAVTVQSEELSSIARLLAQDDWVTFEFAEAPLMTLTFDNHIQGRWVDLRPTLPLLLKC